MKKIITILSLVLALALTATFAVGAATITTNGGSTTQNVTVTYKPYEVPDVYSVDVVWEGFELTYDAGTNNWDAEHHSYNNSGAAWGNSDATVTVTNHSNVAVSVRVAYAAAANAEVGVTITDADPESNGLVKTVELASGVETSHANADKATVTVAANTAQTPTATATLGTVTVTVSKAA